MRGRKPYNIRNVEAHLTSLQNTFNPLEHPVYQAPVRNMVFQTNVGNIGKPTIQETTQPTMQQILNERINAQYGVSKYASNQVSGKMFKKI
jgi:hypothetical protein